MAATSLHDDVLLIPKNVTSERPVSLLPTSIRWWEALRALEVAKWQQKCRVDWEGAVWETFLEMRGSNAEQAKKTWEQWL